MPLLCISLFALLLLPHSHSLPWPCDPQKPQLTEIRQDYKTVVQTTLNDATEHISSLLPNSTCNASYPEPKHRCTSDNTDVVSTLHSLTCKMMNLKLTYTKQLSMHVLQSIRCSCPEKATKETKSKKERTAPRRRRNETKKLCKANAILSTMTECYKMLNIMLMDT